MRVLFCGLGSIGARHLANLRGFCGKNGIGLEVTALRSSSAELEAEVSAMVDIQLQSLPENQNYDIAFITNPTHLHGETLGMLKNRVGTYFIEKPLFESTGYNPDALGLGKGQKAYIAAPMRWCGVFIELAKAIKNVQVYSARAICSSYLPSWRPKADYRNVYSAKKEMGGGVALDLIHEWDYLSALFGFPQSCAVMQGRFSHLEIDSNDLAVYIARYEGFLCELHLDYFGRSYRRDIELFTRQGTIRADFGTGMLYLPDGREIDCTEPVNRRYEREMEYFIGYAQNGQGESVNSPSHAMQVLKTALGEQPNAWEG